MNYVRIAQISLLSLCIRRKRNESLCSAIFRGFRDFKKKISGLNVPIHAVVALKRSGWIVGAYISNQLTIPVFTVSETKSIPKEFKNIIVVDDKAWSGKSMQKVLNKLWKMGKATITAIIYLESGYRIRPMLWVREIPRKGCRMWYESHS